MQKIVCRVCGLANLESFPTYPQCAGCGARLPKIERNPVNEFFQRPVKTWIWAFGMGSSVAILALLSTGIARETRLRDRGDLLVMPRIAQSPQSLILEMKVSTSLPEDREDIRNVRLRFDQEDVRDADIQLISPPASVEDRGKGRYYTWNKIAPGQTIKVELRPRQMVNVSIVANGFKRYGLDISPLPTAPPVDSYSNRSN